MKTHYKLCSAGALLLLLLPSSVFAANATGEMLSYGCTGCHGSEGYSNSDIPDLSGLTKKRLMDKLMGYKSGAEESTLMQRIAKGYTDSELEKLAEFFSREGDGDHADD